MKKLIFTLIVLIIVSAAADTFIIEDGICQWEPDVRLTTGTGNSYTSINRCVATSGANVHVVWYDDRDGNEEIYYKLSIDNGISWSPGTRLTNNSAGYSEHPSIVVNGSNIHIVWEDDRNGYSDIYYINSINGGFTWGTETRLTYFNADSHYPSIAVSGSTVHVVWQDYRNGNTEIYYKKSTDGGSIWGTDLRLTNNSEYSENPSIAINGSNIYVVWEDKRMGNFEIYFKRSTDGGINWGTDTRLTNYSGISANSCIAVSGSTIHVVWYDTRDDNFGEIYYKYSSNGGINWGTDTRLTYNNANSYNPSIAVSGSIVHVTWFDNRDGNSEIYYKYSSNGGINWGADTRLTYNNADSRYPSIAISGTIVHVLWTDYRNGNPCIYYKRNPTGNSIGIKNISSEVPEEFALYQNYPNPFNNTSNLKFEIANLADVKIIVYDVMGREVKTLVNEELQAGSYEVTFDGSALPSGVYYYRLSGSNFAESKKMMLVK